MPVARFQMPDGRVARFEVPSGTTPEQAQAQMEQFFAEQQRPVHERRLAQAEHDLAAVNAEPRLKRNDSLLSTVTNAVGEPLLEGVTGLAGTAAGGVRAIYDLATGKGADQAEKNLRATQEALTYRPRTEAGAFGSAVAGVIPERISRGADYLGDKTAELTNSPMAGAAVKTIGEVAGNALVGAAGSKLVKRSSGVAPPEAPAEVSAPRSAAEWNSEGEAILAERTKAKQPAPVPTRDELMASAKDAYARAKDAGAVISGNSYSGFASGLRESLREEGFNKTLHPKAAAVLNEIEDAQGKPVSFQELEILRRQALAAERSLEADERRVAGLIVDRIDDYADSLGAADSLAGNAGTAAAATKEARSLYSRNRKATEISELIERAKNRESQFSGSGMENALRTEFRNLSNNPKRMRRFTDEEQKAIKNVARGNFTRNVVTQIGKLAPSGGLSQWLAIGGTLINPAVAAAPIAGTIARAGATRMTRNAANAAEELMRRGPLQEANATLGDLIAAEQARRPQVAPLALPAPTMMADARGGVGTAAAREQLGMTPDVIRAAKAHPGRAQETPPPMKTAAEYEANAPAGAAIEFSGDEIGGLNQSMFELKSAARKYAREHFADKSVVNEIDGTEINIPWQAIKHSTAGKVSKNAAIAISKLDELLTKAEPTGKAPDKQGRKDIAGAYYYDANISVGGEPAVIRAVVREHKDGHRYYDHFELLSGQKKSPAPGGGLPVQEVSGAFAGRKNAQSGIDHSTSGALGKGEHIELSGRDIKRRQAPIEHIRQGRE